MGMWKDKSFKVLMDLMKTRRHWTEKDFKDEAFKVYPFGARENTPYKIWLEAVKACVRYLGIYNHTHAYTQETKNDNL